jgi:hypothetical protein
MRYRVFMMLVANSVAAQAGAAKLPSRPERRVRALQVEPKRSFIDPVLLPFVADVSVLRASLLPPSDRIAVHAQLYSEQDPSAYQDLIVHLRANVLWPVARVRSSSGGITQVSLIADRRGRVRREYRVEQPGTRELTAGPHGVILDRGCATPRGLELHGRAWHASGEGRAFSALVHRTDIGYTLDLGKLGGHWLRLDVRGDELLGLSAVSES